MSPIKSVTMHHIAMPMVEVLITSFGNDAERDSLRAATLLELTLESGVAAWGEVVAAWSPGYSYETIGTAEHILGDFFIPAVIGKRNLSGLRAYRGHPMARMGLEAAFYAAVATERGQSLGALLAELGGGLERKTRAEVGVSIGIQPSIEATLAIIEKRLNEGYRRIKLKIKPGWDIDLLRAVRTTYPTILLMADANSAYTLSDIPLFRQMDDLNLMMIEQPLGHMDIYQHSKLQPQIGTPICLDESIHNTDDARLAIEIGAGKIINLKSARVGGLMESLNLHAFCYENGVPLWIGGMLETGVGRSANLALASLPGVTLPSDLSATKRYYDPDLTEEIFELNQEDSTIDVLTAIGLGVQVNAARLAEAKANYAALA
ncbi:MAG: o-succinylbenzoate synthase [Anaerolineales bacterium]|nr:o-succinylbenzoate synthase [Anaerolineales bacterium]